MSETIESLRRDASDELADLREKVASLMAERVAPTLGAVAGSAEAAVRRILVTASNGDRIPLAQLARISTVEAPAAVTREWGKRRIVVQANVRGRDVGSFVDEVAETIDARVTLPPGSYVRFGGQFQHLEDAQRRLLVVVPIALALIFGLPYAT